MKEETKLDLQFSVFIAIVMALVFTFAPGGFLNSQERNHKISPFDILKVQVLVERSGRVKAEYEKLQADIQNQIRAEVTRIYAESGVTQADFDMDLQKAEFIPKDTAKKEGTK